MKYKYKVKHIPKGHPNRKGFANTPQFIVMHYTANTNKGANAEMHQRYFGRAYKYIDNKYYENDGTTPFRNGATHVVIDSEEAVEVIPKDEYVPGAGGGYYLKPNGYKSQTPLAQRFSYRQNFNSIQYELCVNSDGDWSKTVENAVEIVAIDLIKYDIDPYAIFNHYLINGKMCPVPFLRNPERWYKFVEDIRHRFIELKYGTMKSEKATYTVTGNIVNVRSIPEVINDNSIVNQVKQGDEIHSIGYYDKWVGFIWNNSLVYISKTLLHKEVNIIDEENINEDNNKDYEKLITSYKDKIQDLELDMQHTKALNSTMATQYTKLKNEYKVLTSNFAELDKYTVSLEKELASGNCIINFIKGIFKVIFGVKKDKGE